MIDPAILAQCRSAVQTPMTNTAKILRAISTPDGIGGTSKTWNVVHAYPCRVVVFSVSGFERLFADQVKAVSDYTVILPFDADIKATDRLLINDLTTFEPVSTDAIKSEAMSIYCVCKKVGG